ncbi:hypothetical protein Tco_1351421 [Tanacetum coccineum]
MFHRPLILLQIVQLILFIVDSGCTKHMTGNLKLLCNFVEKFLDLIQGNVHRSNGNLYLLCEDLQENDILTVVLGSDLYTNSSSRNTSSTPFCFMAKAITNQAWASVLKTKGRQPMTTLTPVPPRQNVVPSARIPDSSPQVLEFLFQTFTLKILLSNTRILALNKHIFNADHFKPDALILRRKHFWRDIVSLDDKASKLDVKMKKNCTAMLQQKASMWRYLQVVLKDDKSLSDETFQKKILKISPRTLFRIRLRIQNSKSDVNPLFDEELENIKSKDSYVSNLDELALLVKPLSDDNEDECFDPGADVDEIELLLHHDPSTSKNRTFFHS